LSDNDGSFDFGEEVKTPGKNRSDSSASAGTGHRARLRDRLLKGGAEALADYEVLEYLLFAGNPRGDTKPLAKDLLKQFGSLAGVLNADPKALQRVKGVGETTAAALKSVAVAARRMARSEVSQKPVLGSWQALIDYRYQKPPDRRSPCWRWLDRRGSDPPARGDPAGNGSWRKRADTCPQPSER